MSETLHFSAISDPADVWFASVGVSVALFLVVRVVGVVSQLSAAYAHRLTHGPPPPPPEPANIQLDFKPGKQIVIEMTNSGGAGAFWLRGRVVGVSSGYDISDTSVFSINSTQIRLKKGEMRRSTIAATASRNIWIPNVQSSAVSFEFDYYRSSPVIDVTITVLQETQTEMNRLIERTIRIAKTPQKELLTVVEIDAQAN